MYEVTKVGGKWESSKIFDEIKRARSFAKLKNQRQVRFEAGTGTATDGGDFFWFSAVFLCWGVPAGYCSSPITLLMNCCC